MPMLVDGAGADADGATVESTVEDSSERCKSVGGDDLVQNKRQRACLLFLRGEVNGWY
jgi:hypothetical protein